jgi:hypothetical protein
VGAQQQKQQQQQQQEEEQPVHVRLNMDPGSDKPVVFAGWKHHARHQGHMPSVYGALMVWAAAWPHTPHRGHSSFQLRLNSSCIQAPLATVTAPSQS